MYSRGKPSSDAGWTSGFGATPDHVTSCCSCFQLNEKNKKRKKAVVQEHPWEKRAEIPLSSRRQPKIKHG
jgi:hypothetical protein